MKDRCTRFVGEKGWKKFRSEPNQGFNQHLSKWQKAEGALSAKQLHAALCMH
jgi:hypothetical protein